MSCVTSDEDAIRFAAPTLVGSILVRVQQVDVTASVTSEQKACDQEAGNDEENVGPNVPTAEETEPVWLRDSAPQLAGVPSGRVAVHPAALGRLAGVWGRRGICDR